MGEREGDATWAERTLEDFLGIVQEQHSPNMEKYNAMSIERQNIRSSNTSIGTLFNLKSYVEMSQCTVVQKVT